MNHTSLLKLGLLSILAVSALSGCEKNNAKELQEQGKPVAHAHLRYLNPLPRDLGETLRRYDKVLVAELNMGHLRLLLRAEFLINAVGFTKIQGRPFKISEVVAEATRALEAQS